MFDGSIEPTETSAADAAVAPPLPELLVMLRRWKRTKDRPIASAFALLPYVNATENFCTAFENGEWNAIDRGKAIQLTTRVDLREPDADALLAGIAAAGYRPRVVMGSHPKRPRA
jgi:hypothetical protein